MILCTKWDWLSENVIWLLQVTLEQRFAEQKKLQAGVCKCPWSRDVHVKNSSGRWMQVTLEQRENHYCARNTKPPWSSCIVYKCHLSGFLAQHWKSTLEQLHSKFSQNIAATRPSFKVTVRCPGKLAPLHTSKLHSPHHILASSRQVTLEQNM